MLGEKFSASLFFRIFCFGVVIFSLIRSMRSTDTDDELEETCISLDSSSSYVVLIE